MQGQRQHGRVLLTGASGGVGSLLRPRLARPGRTLRLLDLTTPPEMAGTGREQLSLASLDDPESLAEACAAVDAVVHLAGQSVEAPLDLIIERNIRGTLNLLEAARAAGVPRFVFASSTHAVGFHRYDGTPVAADVPARPDTFYGWSKAAMEAAGRLYHERFGMDVICLRIGSCFPTPVHLGVRGLSTWLSPADAHRLVEASLDCKDPGFTTVWGVSRNTRGWMSLAAGEAIGYYPRDDAELFAATVLAAGPEAHEGPPPLLGGSWCDVPLGQHLEPTPHLQPAAGPTPVTHNHNTITTEVHP